MRERGMEVLMTMITLEIARGGIAGDAMASSTLQKWGGTNYRSAQRGRSLIGQRKLKSGLSH